MTIHPPSPFNKYYLIACLFINFSFWAGKDGYAQVSYIADPNPDKSTQASFPSHLYKWKDHIYFSANIKGENSLWRTDGTNEGTQRLLQGVDVLEIYGDEDNLWLNAFHTAIGIEVWKGNGEPNSFQPVKDIYPGPNFSFFLSRQPSNFLTVNGKTFFLAVSNSSGRELWVSDGTHAGTQIVREFVDGLGNSRITGYTAFQNLLFFVRTNENGQWELWRTDGTNNETILIKSVKPRAAQPGPPQALQVFQDHLFFFAANDSIHGLWKSDGTSSGTQLIFSTPPGFSKIIPHPDKLYFLTASPSNRDGTALWTSNGLLWDLTLIKDFENYEVTEASVLFESIYLAGNKSLWISDGSKDGTHLLKTKDHDGFVFHEWEALGDQAIIRFGSQIWISDGTPQHTLPINSCKLPKANFLFSHLVPNKVLTLGNYGFFAGYANTDSKKDVELWITDGTETGTRRFKDLNDVPVDASLELLGKNEQQMFFRSRTSIGTELWRSDGTTEGSYTVKDLCPGPADSNPGKGTFVGKDWYFPASNCRESEPFLSLWKTDGTEAGTDLIRDIRLGTHDMSFSNMTTANGKLFFAASDTASDELNIELWVSDGTEVGTFKLKEIVPGSGYGFYSYPDQFIALEDKVIFVADDGDEHGVELWVSDGTSSGTYMIKDIYEGPLNGLSYQPQFTLYDNQLIFVGEDSRGGRREIWKTDGTTNGTSIIKNVAPTEFKDAPIILGQTKDELIFSHTVYVKYAYNICTTKGTDISTSIIPEYRFIKIKNSPVDYDVLPDYTVFMARLNSDEDSELWRTDGTAAGTLKLTNHATSQGNTTFSDFIYYKGITYFLARENRKNSRVIWQSDGSPEGTHIAKGLDMGAPFSQPRHLFLFQNNIFFIADHPTYGESLFQFIPPPEAAETDIYQLYIRPNPSANLIQISWPQMLEAEATFSFYDTKGNLVREDQIAHPEMGHEFIIQLGGMSPGLYFLKVSQLNRVIIGKLIVL